ncbi:hypothetical protein [Amycolatopsis sp. WGS_07]|uniref:hypothetical protein n=1 Tax=Amycolatopsis sp. WGS_07 TaxID=3076764 RepID=UPI00387371F2
MATVTRARRRSRSPDPANSRGRPLNLWGFALQVLREPNTAREARWFAVAAGVFVLTVMLLALLAFVVRPVEAGQIVGSIGGLIRG